MTAVAPLVTLGPDLSGPLACLVVLLVAHFTGTWVLAMPARRRARAKHAGGAR